MLRTFERYDAGSTEQHSRAHLLLPACYQGYLPEDELTAANL